MKNIDKNTIEGFVRHAEHYGVEEVFETALDEGLGVRDLRSLALRLQNLDSCWKLTPECQRFFVLAMTQHGFDRQMAAHAAGVTMRTAGQWCDEQEVLKEDPLLALRRASNRRAEDLQGIVRKPAKRRW